MELKTMILGHFLVISLALNAGLLYKDYCNNGKHKSVEFFSFKTECKNESLVTKRDTHVAGRFPFESSSSKVVDGVIDLDHGDPTMYERYWQQMGDKTTVVIPGWKFVSYFSDKRDLCWFLEPELASSIIRLHKLVGNAVTENRYIVVGTGSTQLFQAVLYALSPSNASEPIDVLSAAPFYSMPVAPSIAFNYLCNKSLKQDFGLESCEGEDRNWESFSRKGRKLLSSNNYMFQFKNYIHQEFLMNLLDFLQSYPLITEFLKSGLYKWGGDAHKFRQNKPYIELVTSPNNPDGLSRQAVVDQDQGMLIHDLAYYWPQYTPISYAADHNIMLFTVSKTTGHAGTRLGWALVKDEEIAKKMTEFIMLSTIGVSKESQLRAAKILQVVSDTHEYHTNQDFREGDSFFEHSYYLMAKRWKQLRNAVNQSKIFSLPHFPSAKCTFNGHTFATQPAFAWLKCEGEIYDCEKFLREHKILTRSGKHFGDSTKYVRVSVLPRDEEFQQFTDRLRSII